MNKIVAFILVVVASYSCSLTPSWDVDGVAPIIQTRLSLASLIGEDYIDASTDSSLKLVFEDTLYSLKIDSLSENIVINESSVVNWTLPTVTLVNFAPLQNVASLNIPFDLGEARVEEVIVKNGRLVIQINSVLKRGFHFRYHSDRVSKNNVPFSYSGYVPAAPQNDTARFRAELDMSGYSLDLKPITNGVVNTLKLSTDIEFDSAGGPLLMVANQLMFKANTQIDELNIYSIKGYLGKYNFDLSNSSFDLEVLKKFPQGTIDVDAIQAELQFINYIGADAQLYINYLRATNTRTGVSLSLTNQYIQNMLNINRAVHTNNTMNPIVSTTSSIFINSNNSNIHQILNFLPDKFELDANVKLNPQGNSSGYNDFYYPDYPTYIFGKIVAPLKFSINQVSFVDTLSNPFLNFELGKNFLEGALHANIINKFPLAATAKIYLLENNQITDSIYSTTTILAAPVNNQNKVINSIATSVSFVLNETKFENLRNAQKLLLKVHFETQPNATLLQMYSDYFMDVKITSDIKFRVQL